MTAIGNSRPRGRFALRTGAAVLGLWLVAGMPAQADGVTGDAGAYLAAKQAEMRGDVAGAAEYYAKALSRDADNPALLERAMIHKIAAGAMGEGIALARRLEEIEPGHHLGVLALAASLLRAGEWDAARALVSEGGPYVGHVIDAWALFAAGDVEASRERFTGLEQSDENGRPGQIVAAYHLGLMEAAAGNDENAAAALERAMDMSEGGTIRMTEERAGALARLGRVEDAQAVIAGRLAGTYGNIGLSRLSEQIGRGEMPSPRVSGAPGGAAEALFGVAGLLARGRNRLIALAYARISTYLDPDLDQAQLLIAQILDEDRQYALAIEAYDAIPKDSPQAMSAMIGRAEVLQADEQLDEAIAAMDEVIATFPKALEAYTAKGDMLRRERMFEEASEAYDRAVKLLPLIEPHHWALFYQRGITYERSKQWDKAEADFRKALELEPDQPDVLNYLGYSLVELGRNLDEAEEMIEKAVEQRPDDGYIVDSLGWVLYRFADFDRAVEQLERAVELRPTDPVINDHFGDALWMVGRRTEARFQWKRALSFEPTEEEAVRIRRKLAEGLDRVLVEEKAEGLPGIIGRSTPADDGGNANDGG